MMRIVEPGVEPAWGLAHEEPERVSQQEIAAPYVAQELFMFKL